MAPRITVTPAEGAIFSDAQRTAIATYLASLPELVDLEQEDAKRVSRSLDRYWRQFLPADQ